MDRLVRIKVLLFLVVIGVAGEVFAIKVKDRRPFHFVVKAPREIELGKPFKVTIIAYDNNNRLVRTYDRIGYDVGITTTGTGTISPNIVRATSFRKGKAIINFVYDNAPDAEDFDILATPIEPETSKGVYLIAAGDTLEISVWEAEGLTKDVIVTPDGMISFPLIGEIVAEGKTLRELDDEVTKKISTYVRNPQVSVMVKKIGGRRVIVLGEVRTPGVYHITGEGTVMEAIAMAGGTTPEAITRSVAIVRGDLHTNPQVMIVSLDRVFTHGAIPKEYIIHPQDIVYVPKHFISSAAHFINKLIPSINTLFGTPFVVTD